jgi:signal transduction histidine kinase/CheY-like chemotaxis protein
MATTVSLILAFAPDAGQRKQLSTLDPGAGLVLHLCSNSREADRLAQRIGPDVVLAGRGAGLAWLAQARSRDPDAFRIMWTDDGHLAEAIEAVNRGQADAVLREPFATREAVALLHHGCEQALLRRHTRSLVDELAVRNAELLDFNERLEDLVAERTHHLVEAQDRLQESQRQMVQLETQATVTHLLRGLAHEFNNPLAAIYGYTQRLRRQLDANADAARRLDVILQEVEHCRTVVHQLSHLATPLSELAVRTEPAEALRDGLARLTAAGRSGPSLDIAPELPDVIAAPRALARVFEEVLANAADAGARSVHISGEMVADHARLLLTNDGETPDETTVANAVRPFFTTRAGENRRGLGLSTAAALLREQEGTIALACRDDGPGAVVVIVLPAADPLVHHSSSRLLPALTAPITGAQAQPSITLVVDDEPMVAEILVDALCEAGCTTATAGSVAEGLAELTRLDVRALVVDLHLPDGSGLDLARRALALKPALAGHIALATGDTDRNQLDHLVAEHGFPVLGKPFRLEEVQALAKRLA